MIIPKFWAEAKIQKQVNGSQVTLKRFGWSDENQNIAQAHAELRAEEAFEKFSAGEDVKRREAKVAYNGADGLPIREEVISTHNDVVITRNSYGALCLNTPDVLFADIDLIVARGANLHYLSNTILFLLAVAVGLFTGSFMYFLVIIVFMLLLGSVLAKKSRKKHQELTDVSENLAKEKIIQFSENNPDWHLRCYRTPAGFRVLVMHDVFDPNGEQALDFLESLESDPLYVLMCKKQQCFRARVSPKPWRAGIHKAIRPRPGVWPLNPKWLPIRQEWVQNYETITNDFASCRFEETLGSERIHPKAEFVQELHDDLCKAHSSLSLA